MAEPISDAVFEYNLLRVQLLSEERIQRAKLEQFRLARGGPLMPLGEVLVRLGDLTPALRERIEKMPSEQSGDLKMLGPFKLLSKLGEGSMGMVYLAQDTRTQRNVALKTLPKRYAEDSEFRVRFQREARAAQTILHENIVAAYESGEDQGYHYFAMELCEGEGLDSVLERELALPWMAATNIVLQVARGLACAHAHGFIHRDVKPANIMMVPSTEKDGPAVAKLLDLGLTKNIGSSQSTFKTEAGALLGTPQYISPEQARGDADVDGRSDIYSLGATFYHLMTGEAPFQAHSAERVIQKHLSDPLVNPQDLRSDIPDGVAQVIQKMMAKVPADRYGDCSQLARDLELVLIGQAPDCSPVAENRTTVASRKEQRRRSTGFITSAAAETILLPSSNPNRMMDDRALDTWGLSRPKRLTLFALAGVLGFVAALALGWMFRGSLATAVRRAASDGAPNSAHVPTPHENGLGAEVLIDENFELFDLARLPSGWTAHEPEHLALAPLPDHGNTLLIANAAGESGHAGMDIALPIEKIRGRMMRISAQAQCPKGFAATEQPAGSKPGIELQITLANGYRAPEKKSGLQPGDRDWKRLSITSSIPQNVTEVKISLNVSGVAAEAFFDDFKVELLPEN